MFIKSRVYYTSMSAYSCVIIVVAIAKSRLLSSFRNGKIIVEETCGNKQREIHFHKAHF